MGKDKGQDAHNKGQEDHSKSGGLAKSNPVEEFLNPTYDPPKGYEKEYKQGHDNAKKQSK